MLPMHKSMPNKKFLFEGRLDKIVMECSRTKMVERRIILMAQEKVSSNRIEYIDILKGIAVLLVIVGHCWTFSGKFINKIIMAFHMPLFFFASGYLFKHTEAYKRDAIDVIIKKLKHLIIPYFMFEGINLLLSLIIRPYYGNLIHESMVIQSIVLCLNTSEYEGVCLRLWFLPAAFISCIYMLFICKLKRYYDIVMVYK